MRKLAALLCLLAPLAEASYFLPPVKERYFVLADAWELKKTKRGYDLRVKRHGKTHTFQVDLFWLADRIHSDSICTGSHQSAMRAYLRGFLGLKKPPPLVVELVSTKKRKKLFAAGLWLHEGTTIYDRVSKGGTPKLLPYAEAVKLKDAKALEKILQKKSAEAWKALTARQGAKK
ncbi:MAG: hypothetical protein ACYTEZ_15520 [Planctomycetota bacterium]|jgi:hypothetical protein